MRGQIFCAALAATALLAGCGPLPYPREMGDMALLRTLGVDRAGDNSLSVTASTGPQAGGMQGEQEPALVLSARRDSLRAACLAMQSLSYRYVFFGYVDQLLLGEDLARADVRPILDACARSGELSLGAQLWLTLDQTAEDAIRAGGSGGVDRQLITLGTDGEMGLSLLPRTAGEVYADLLDRGCAYAPALTQGAEDASLTAAGYGILKDGALTGVLTGGAARGLERLAGGGQADVWTQNLGGNQAVLQAEGAGVTCLPQRDKVGALSGLTVTCRVRASIEENDTPLTTAERDLAKRAVIARETVQIRAALTQLQAWGTDCIGLGLRAAAQPGIWSETGEPWPERFARLPISLTIRVQLSDG